MAGTGSCCTTLSSTTLAVFLEINFCTSWLKLDTRTHGGGTILGQPTRHRRKFSIRAEVDFVSAEEAKELVAVEGYTVIDVRDKSQYERAHIKSCHHVPLFIENQDNDFGTIIKRTLHNNFSGLFYGLPFTKPNPEFVESVKTKFSPESKLLLVCQEGLRSAGAANKLEQVGFENIACITSGLQSVKPVARCRQSRISHCSGKDLSCTWNSTNLCLFVHHLLSRSSREDTRNFRGQLARMPCIHL
ncbi:rhodanese-like domain-containing protein 9 [Pyrus ussuriensis x Pyrus communis]|uniref:Rhodanese-like domain-containing protein 9 n=1 Tax=Pyrus ussuriensis x Pyrus communis TaxID=2448454 RepID=A0A5N5GBS1_9ROSA|nr:rhodanese-like domain-containing protein 9 [Pyrus ussuriensis x Pyrus communis]